MVKSLKQLNHLKKLALLRKGKKHTKEAKDKMSKTKVNNRPNIRKFCINCKKEFFQHRYNGGRWEGFGKFSQRKYCSLYCARHSDEFAKQMKYLWSKSKIEVSGKYDQLKHRNIIEEFLGRKLKSNEIIHHINGNRGDNRIENLKIMTTKEHLRLHLGK